jgi:CubicO group peptidase (beta-lactamase class C family)
MILRQLNFRGLLFGLTTVVLMFHSIACFPSREDVEAFVTRFYEKCLERSPDQPGLDYWTDSLLDGSQTGSDVAKGFIFSQEFINRNLTDEEIMKILYEAFFNREADTGGIIYWLDKLRSGVDRATVLDGFIYSQEFAVLCNEYGILPFPVSDPVVDFVTRFYQLCLGRDPDQSGLDYWVNSLKDGTRTGAEVAYGFVFSPEFTNMKVTNEQYLNILYHAFFNREADQGGFNSWLDQLDAGVDREEILNGFIYALEFFNLCHEYGINASNILEYVSPEAVGYSSDKLAEAKKLAEQSGYAAVMALYDGKVFFSWGDVTRNYWCHSIRKPFLSALYGIYLDRGDINLDATLAQLNIDDIPPSLTPEEKQATVRHLLMSRSGVYHEAAAEAQIMIDTRPPRGSHAPNTFFYYNNWDFNALGTIFRQETGEDIFEAFKKDIADIVGMQDFSITNCFYQYEPKKSMYPAYHFRMSARDMARFGVLYQKNGKWKNWQIIPSEWVGASIQAYSVEKDAAGVGYGYMWKVFPEGSEFAQTVGFSGYFHTGNAVHSLVIVPELKLVLVERYNTDGNWTDPGDVGLEIGLMIVNSRISE